MYKSALSGNYSFANNNPIYWADPTGLLSDAFVTSLWSNSGSNTTWFNDGNGTFSNDDGYIDQKTGEFTAFEKLREVIIYAQKTSSSTSHFSGNLVGLAQNKAYSYGRYYAGFRDRAFTKQLDDLASVFQDSGDLSMVLGTVLVLTGVGAPLGGLLITYGGYTSTAGTILELRNDYKRGKWSTQKAITKLAIEAIPSGRIGKKAFNYLGEPLGNELLNVGTIAADRLLDELRKENAGPYRKN